jgi:hypothetical protein
MDLNFFMPLKNAKALLEKIKDAVKREKPPAHIEAEESTIPGHIIIVISKLGKSLIEIETRPVNGGINCGIASEKIAALHSPYISSVRTWIIENIITANGGNLSPTRTPKPTATPSSVG